MTTLPNGEHSISNKLRLRGDNGVPAVLRLDEMSYSGQTKLSTPQPAVNFIEALVNKGGETPQLGLCDGREPAAATAALALEQCVQNPPTAMIPAPTRRTCPAQAACAASPGGTPACGARAG